MTEKEFFGYAEAIRHISSAAYSAQVIGDKYLQQKLLDLRVVVWDRMFPLKGGAAMDYRMMRGIGEPIDRKFVFGAMSKTGNAYNEFHGVLFLAKDKTFARTLPTYIENLKADGASPEQIQGAELLLERVQRYQREHPDLVKVPDIDRNLEASVLEPNR